MPTTNVYPDHVDFGPEGKPQLPSSINILTILTFIGCGFGLIFVAFMPLFNKLMLGFMEKAASSNPDISANQLAEIEQGKSVIELTQANMVPLMAISFIGIGLCIWGAVWMRKLKKDGYWIYLGGELLPLIGTFILLGTAQFTGVASVVIGIGIPLLFVSLYTMQRKFLVY